MTYRCRGLSEFEVGYINPDRRFFLSGEIFLNFNKGVLVAAGGEFGDGEEAGGGIGGLRRWCRRWSRG